MAEGFTAGARRQRLTFDVAGAYLRLARMTHQLSCSAERQVALLFGPFFKVMAKACEEPSFHHRVSSHLSLSHEPSKQGFYLQKHEHAMACMYGVATTYDMTISCSLTTDLINTSRPLQPPRITCNPSETTINFPGHYFQNHSRGQTSRVSHGSPLSCSRSATTSLPYPCKNSTQWPRTREPFWKLS